MIINIKDLKNKIIYRANYRGTKEMDILLGAFVKKNIDNLSIDELKDLYNFLSFDDTIIYDFYQNNISTSEISKNKISSIFKLFKL